MKKRMLSALLCIAMTAVMVMGCGSGGNSDSGDAEGVVDEDAEVSDALVEELKGMVPDHRFLRYDTE